MPNCFSRSIPSPRLKEEHVKETIRLVFSDSPTQRRVGSLLTAFNRKQSPAHAAFQPKALPQAAACPKDGSTSHCRSSGQLQTIASGCGWVAAGCCLRPAPQACLEKDGKRTHCSGLVWACLGLCLKLECAQSLLLNPLPAMLSHHLICNIDKATYTVKEHCQLWFYIFRRHSQWVILRARTPREDAHS